MIYSFFVGYFFNFKILFYLSFYTLPLYNVDDRLLEINMIEFDDLHHDNF